MVFSVVIHNTRPHQYVTALESRRAAQIIAGLLAERFPVTLFTYREGGVFSGPDCHPSIRDCARSSEVQKLTDRIMKAETNNPDDLPKWCVFFYDNGPDAAQRWQVNAYLEHDRDVIERCRADKSLSGSTDIFSPYPSSEEVQALVNRHAKNRAGEAGSGSTCGV